MEGTKKLLNMPPEAKDGAKAACEASRLVLSSLNLLTSLFPGKYAYDFLEKSRERFENAENMIKEQPFRGNIRSRLEELKHLQRWYIGKYPDLRKSIEEHDPDAVKFADSLPEEEAELLGAD